MSDNPRGQNFDVNRNLLPLRSFATSLKNNLFEVWFYTFFFMILYMYIALGQGLTTSWGRNFNDNRNILSLRSFVSKTSLWSLIFSYFIHVHSRRSGADNPRRQNFDVNRNLLSLCSFATRFKKISLKSDFIHFVFMITNMYIAPGQGLTTPLPLWDEILMSTGTSCNFGHLLQV